ncbi:MAG: hypothetical protein ACRDSL_10930 [Pseudonocardiaceae bacterium]
MAVVLAALSAAFLAVALIAGLLVVTYRWVLRRHLIEELVRLAGPSIVQALLPQQVMTTFLSRIYGDGDANHDVVAGVLGGEGAEPHGADLTISTHTTVDLKLQAINHETYELISTVTYSFKENVTDHRFVIFAMCDMLLRDSITLACRLPLFESWFVPDQSLFEKSVDAMLPSVHIGIRYTDREGSHHDVPPGKVELTEVSYRDWPDYLTFFRRPLGTMPRQNPARFMGTLRIFECDLGELADVDHAVASVENLSLQSTTLQRVDDGSCFWQAPYPCYVERIGFDAAALTLNGGISWLFRVAPFTFRSLIATGGWTPAEQLNDLAVRSWLLPGHGVALLWKPSAHDHNTGDRIPAN